MAISTRARKRILFLLVAVVGVSAITAAGLQWRRAQAVRAAAESRERGLELYAQGEWDQAMKALNRSGNVRNDAEVLVALADCRRNSVLESGRHIPVAISFAQQALVDEPANERAMDILIDLYSQQNQITELIDIADRRLSLDPANHEALWARGRGLAALGRAGDAEAIEAFVEAYPEDVRGHALRIQHMLNAGSGAEEVRAYADAQAELRPRSAEFLLLQAEARVRTSAPGDSLDDIRLDAERAASLEMEDPQSLARVVQLLDMLGQNGIADDLLTRELGTPGIAADAVTIAIERDWKAGRIEQARERAREAGADADRATPAILGWSVLLADPDEPQGADHPNYAALRLRTEAGARFWVHLIDGRSALERGDWGMARSSLTTALQSPAARAGALAPLDIAEYLLGQAELSLGSWREAASRWERVASRNPSWTRVRLELAALAIENGLYRESFDHAGRVLASNPSSYEAGKAAARAMVFMLENGEAELDAADETVALMQELRTATEGYSDVELAQILALEARTRLIRGEDDLAQRAVDQLASLSVTPPAADLLPLLDQAQVAGLAGLDRLTVRGADTGARDAQTAAAILQREASSIAALGRADEARGLFVSAIEGASEADRPAYERAYALWLSSVGEADGVEMLERIASENPRSALAQIDLLNSHGAWNDRGSIEPAIDRLREVGGESSVAWRVFQARALLTFEPSEASAAQAIELLGPGLRTTAPDAAALAIAGEAMVVLGDTAAAAEYFGRAIDADARRVSIYPRLIVMLQSNGRLELARTRQREFARRARVEGPLLQRRAELSEALDLWEEAVADRRVLALADGAGAFERARLGAALAKSGSVAEADAVFESVAAKPIGSIETLAIVADYLSARDRVDEAFAVIEAASIDESSRSRLAASLMAKQGRTAEAVELLTRVAEAEPSALVYGDLARLAMQAGDYAAASAAVNSGLAIDPESTDLGALAAAVRLQTGEAGTSEALAELARAAQGENVAPGFSELIEATQRVSEDGDLETYIRTLEDIASRTPASVLLSRLLSTAYLQSGNAERGVAVAADAARVFPHSAEAAQNAAEIFAEAGRLTEAETMARRWLNQTANVPAEQIKAREAVARLALAREDYQQAIAALEPVREQIISEVQRHGARVDVYARALAGAGESERAGAVFADRIGDGDELWFRLFQSTAVAFHRTPEVAREWLTESTAVARRHPGLMIHAAQGWFDLATITADSVDYEQAVAVLELIENVEETPGVMLLAVSLEQLDRDAESEERYRQALALSPDHPIILNNLAYLISKQENPSEEAVTLAERAFAGAQSLGYPPSQLANFLQTLGAVLEAFGRTDEAEARYREGLTFSQTDPNLLYSLAKLLSDRGEVNEASMIFGRISPDLEALGVDAEFVEKYEALKTRLSQTDPTGP